MKTSNLSGNALDWAVAKCETLDQKEGCESFLDGIVANPTFPHKYQPSTDWAQGGPIIGREKISIRCESHSAIGGWYAVCGSGENIAFHTVEGVDGGGDTALIAAMRCYVASKLGDKIDIPEELK